MISSSRLAKTLAVSAAAALHGAAIWGFATDKSVEIEGSAGSVETNTGSSFAEMAAGMFSAAETQEIIDEVPPEAIDDAAPAELIQPVPLEPVTDAEPPAEALTASLAERVQPSEEQPPLEPTREAQLPLVQTPREKAQEPRAPQLTKPEMADVIEPKDDPTPSVTHSLRPRIRSAELEKRAERSKKVAKTKPKKKSHPRGNAAQNAAAGTETGKTQNKAVVAGTGASKKKATGNAAASNYPGKVMKKISRVPKPRVGKKGTSVVAFTIAPGGGLSAISLARSSGSAILDQAALRVVQRAAPFPPPPAGRGAVFRSTSRAAERKRRDRYGRAQVDVLFSALRTSLPG